MRDPGDSPPSFLVRAMSWAQGGTPRAVAPTDASAALPGSGAVTVDVGLARDAKHDDAKSLAGDDCVEGLDIAFDRLTFTVPGRRGSAGIQILRDACGYASAGRLTAMQGPSGAGKVSWLVGRGGERGGRGRARVVNANLNASKDASRVRLGEPSPLLAPPTPPAPMRGQCENAD